MMPSPFEWFLIVTMSGVIAEVTGVLMGWHEPLF